MLSWSHRTRRDRRSASRGGVGCIPNALCFAWRAARAHSHHSVHAAHSVSDAGHDGAVDSFDEDGAGAPRPVVPGHSRKSANTSKSLKKVSETGVRNCPKLSETRDSPNSGFPWDPWACFQVPWRNVTAPPHCGFISALTAPYISALLPSVAPYSLVIHWLCRSLGLGRLYQ